MQKTKPTIVFATIAQREIDFFLAVAKEMKLEGFQVEFVSFFQPGNQQLEEAGFKVYDLYKVVKGRDVIPNISQIQNEYDISNLRKMILHEKATFGIKNSSTLYHKFASYLSAMDFIVKDIQKRYEGKKLVFAQELGGFIAPLSLYYVCQKHKMNHFFFEPSYFKGRLLFNLNILDAPFFHKDHLPDYVEPKVKEYLSNAKKDKKVIIPQKDAHHFKEANFSKLVNADNIRKFTSKLFNKYIKGQKQEYEHIYNHVKRFVLMLFNRKLLGRIYKNYEPKKWPKFFYFPFHVKLDYALTVRSQEYLDQVSLVSLVAKTLPPNVSLVIKEHPASVGGFSYRRLKHLVEENDNIILAHPNISTYDLVEESLGIVTINSKVGAEALCLGKPVATLGDSFYKLAPGIDKLNDVDEVGEWVKRVMHSVPKNETSVEVEKFFTQIWNSSYPTELYELEPNNVKAFSESMVDAVENLSTTAKPNQKVFL